MPLTGWTASCARRCGKLYPHWQESWQKFAIPSPLAHAAIVGIFRAVMRSAIVRASTLNWLRPISAVFVSISPQAKAGNQRRQASNQRKSHDDSTSHIQPVWRPWHGTPWADHCSRQRQGRCRQAPSAPILHWPWRRKVRLSGWWTLIFTAPPCPEC